MSPQSHSLTRPSVKVILSRYGSARSGLLPDTYVLLKSGNADNGGLVHLLMLVYVICSAIRGHCSLVSSLSRTSGTSRHFADIIFYEWVCRPPVKTISATAAILVPAVVGNRMSRPGIPTFTASKIAAIGPFYLVTITTIQQHGDFSTTVGPKRKEVATVVAGLVCLELYKMVGPNGSFVKSVPLDRFKNGFVNLALPFIAFSEPIAAPVKKYGEKSFTLWDCLEVRGPKSFGELIDWIEKFTNTTVSMLSSGNSLLYAFFQPQKRAERESMSVEDVVELVSRNSIPSHRRSLVFEVTCSAPVDGADMEDEDVEVPYIKYILQRH